MCTGKLYLLFGAGAVLQGGVRRGQCGRRNLEGKWREKEHWEISERELQVKLGRGLRPCTAGAVPLLSVLGPHAGQGGVGGGRGGAKGGWGCSDGASTG